MVKTKDYNLSLTGPLKNRIAKHRFTGEKNDPLMNRLFRRLQRAIAADEATPMPGDEILNHSPIGEGLNFSLPDDLQKLVNKNWQGKNWRKPKRGELAKTLYLLAWWATEMPPMPEEKSPQALLSLLPPGRSIAADILDTLTDHCSRDCLVKFLLQLHDAGAIRLLDVETHGDAPRRRLGRDRYVGFIEVVDQNDRKRSIAI